MAEPRGVAAVPNEILRIIFRDLASLVGDDFQVKDLSPVIRVCRKWRVSAGLFAARILGV
jgi:hypothetical protein